MTVYIEPLDRPHVALDLEPVDTAVCVAREVLKVALDDWGAAHLKDDAVLIASELVTNALRHAGLISFRACLDAPGRVTLEVWDDDPAPPLAAAIDLGSEHGRGLLIVGALAADWGWRPLSCGKVVWAIISELPAV
ncbi:ATP-binding protein [Actinomadura fibrosa]|uniref:ATP-binding protein n=1 Tax=Actinomadura fibrosa TaxID=111802 RepID=A0ABW2Y0V6_9ACTN|nr:ATP-binding protein [Actinomadura fibrosa]